MATSGYPACYRPLPPGPDNIRLLRLLPSKDESAPICCQLLDYSLRGFGKRGHQYECLSYCWGSPEKPCSIDIDGVSLPITESLNGALLQLRDHTLERHLWVDAVCINQEDISEKEEQIQMMAKIYSQARQVVVWLGPEADDSDYAIKFIRHAGAGKITVLSGVESSYDDSDESSIDSSDDNRGGSALTALLQRPWFRRIWILQEVAAAKHVHMVCGTAEIAGYSLCLGVDTLKGFFKAQPVMKTLIHSVSRLIRGGFFRSNTDMIAANRSSLRIYPLGELLDMYHTHQASLKHDKVYALLAMCSDDVRKAGIMPNYDMPWEKLLQTVCEHILGEQVVVQTWPGSALSIIKGKGNFVGCISGVYTVSPVTHEEQNMLLTIIIAPGHGKSKENFSVDCTVHASPHPVQEGDLVCHLEGSSKLSIIRTCNNHFVVIAIAVTPPEDVELRTYRQLYELPAVSLVLVWDWMWKNETQENADQRYMMPIYMWEDNEERHHIPLDNDNHTVQESLQAEKGCYQMGVSAAIRMIVRDESQQTPRSVIFARLLLCNQGYHVTEDLLLEIIRNKFAPGMLLRVVFETRPKERILAETSESVLVAAASLQREIEPMKLFIEYLGDSIHITETVWLEVLAHAYAPKLAFALVGVQGGIRGPITEAMVVAAVGNYETRTSLPLLEILFEQNEMRGIDNRALIIEAVKVVKEKLKNGDPWELRSKEMLRFLSEKQAEYTT